MSEDEVRWMCTLEQGQRLVTIFVYLSDCEGGGCTYFPKIDFRSRPSKGEGILYDEHVYLAHTRAQQTELILHNNADVTTIQTSILGSHDEDRTYWVCTR